MVRNANLKRLNLALTPSTHLNLFLILICFFLVPKEISFCKPIEQYLLQTGPSQVRWEKDGISISGCHQNVFCSIFSQIRTDFESVQGPCTMNVRNEPFHDMACVEKCEPPPEWRWKLCDFQHGKRISSLRKRPRGVRERQPTSPCNTDLWCDRCLLITKTLESPQSL